MGCVLVVTVAAADVGEVAVPEVDVGDEFEAPREDGFNALDVGAGDFVFGVGDPVSGLNKRAEC